jgi:hypothetical protein
MFVTVRQHRIRLFLSYSMSDVITQLNSNQRLIRSQSNSSKLSHQSSMSSSSTVSSATNTSTLPARFTVDTQGLDTSGHFLAPSAYPFVNHDLAHYAADAFVCSHLSDFNYRSETSTNHHPTVRISPYARQTFYPMYTQREIHSPSHSTTDYT